MVHDWPSLYTILHTAPIKSLLTHYSLEKQNLISVRELQQCVHSTIPLLNPNGKKFSVDYAENSWSAYHFFYWNVECSNSYTTLFMMWF